MSLTPEGLYKAKIRSWGITRAKTGTFQIYFDLRIDQRANNEDDPKMGFTNTERPLIRTLYMALTPNTQERVFSELRYIGYDREHLSRADLDPTSGTAYNFEGTEVLVSCTHEEYRDKMREKFQVARRRSFVPLTPDQGENFDNLFSEAYQQHIKENPPVPAANIPF
jgi:hypothetical protein